MNENANERTEKATKRKRDKAREEGQVLKSREISSAFSVVALFGFIYIVWDQFLISAATIMQKDLSAGHILSSSEEITSRTVVKAYSDALIDGLGLLWPVLLIALLCGILFNVLQTGFMMSPKAIAPKFSRINPIEGFKRIFSSRSVAEMIKALLKVSFLCYFAYSEYMKLLKKFPLMMNSDVSFAFTDFMMMALIIGIKMGMVFAFIAVLDFFYQYWRYEKDLMMTKQEVKQEHKQMEGDPQIKGMIKRRQRQMSRQRMMKNVQEADVVITNPTHYAVAIRYKESEDKAPQVLAKGADYLAKKIRERAKECSIEIVENKPVAQSLYKYCEVGDEVPRDLYQAVAEILAYVYRIKNKGRATRR